MTESRLVVASGREEGDGEWLLMGPGSSCGGDGNVLELEGGVMVIQHGECTKGH